MKRILFSILLCLTAFSSWAVDFDFSNDSKVAAGVRFGVSLFPSWEIEIDAEYRPLRYIGANVGLLYITSLNNKTNKIGFDPNKDLTIWEIHGFRDASYRLLAKAGIQFTTPAIMLSKDEMGLSLRVSPGITIPIPTNKNVTIDNYELVIVGDTEEELDNYEFRLESKEYYKNSGAKFCYWHVRAEMVLEYEEQWEFTLGYSYSTLDLYGGSRNIVVKEFPLISGDKEPMHTFHIGLTYKF